MSTVLKKDTALELDIDEEDINSLHKTTASEIAFYEEVLAKFQMKYGPLAEFEAELANAELPEHPYWDESIEYRNAYEELDNLKKLYCYRRNEQILRHKHAVKIKAIEFDPAKFDKTPVIYTFEAGKWVRLDTTVVGNKAIAKVTHFSTFVLFDEEVEVVPTLTPTVKPTATTDGRAWI